MDNSSSHVNPLANPKGIKLVCHLCDKPARIQCSDCRVTYYCNSEHQTTDWRGIHSHVCKLLASLRAPFPYANSATERKNQHKQRQQTRDNITNISLTEARKHLHNGDHAIAFPPSLLALKLLTETHGLAHLQLTPALLLLAQCSLGQGHLRNAEQFLSQAQWTILQNHEATPVLRSQLFRNLGLLATAKGDYTGARRHLAEDIYQSSLASGTHSIQTVGGLYHLGDVFLKENKPLVAFSFFEEVVKIWLSHLDDVLQDIIRVSKLSSSVFSLPGETIDPFKTNKMDEAEIVEAKHHLQSILSHEDFNSYCSSSLMYWMYYTFALLHIVMKDHHKASVYINEAIKAKGDCNDPDIDRPLKTTLQELNELMSELKKSLHK